MGINNAQLQCPQASIEEDPRSRHPVLDLWVIQSRLGAGHARLGYVVLHPRHHRGVGSVSLFSDHLGSLAHALTVRIGVSQAVLATYVAHRGK